MTAAGGRHPCKANESTMMRNAEPPTREPTSTAGPQPQALVTKHVVVNVPVCYRSQQVLVASSVRPSRFSHAPPGLRHPVEPLGGTGPPRLWTIRPGPSAIRFCSRSATMLICGPLPIETVGEPYNSPTRRSIHIRVLSHCVFLFIQPIHKHHAREARRPRPTTHPLQIAPYAGRRVDHEHHRIRHVRAERTSAEKPAHQEHPGEWCRRRATDDGY